MWTKKTQILLLVSIRNPASVEGDSHIYQRNVTIRITRWILETALWILCGCVHPNTLLCVFKSRSLAVYCHLNIKKLVPVLSQCLHVKFQHLYSNPPVAHCVCVCKCGGNFQFIKANTLTHRRSVYLKSFLYGLKCEKIQTCHMIKYLFSQLVSSCSAMWSQILTFMF